MTSVASRSPDFSSSTVILCNWLELYNCVSSVATLLSLFVGLSGNYTVILCDWLELCNCISSIVTPLSMFVLLSGNSTSILCDWLQLYKCVSSVVTLLSIFAFCLAKYNALNEGILNCTSHLFPKYCNNFILFVGYKNLPLLNFDWLVPNKQCQNLRV